MMSQKLSDDDITELCKAIEIYQNELKKAELEITHLNSKLEETNEKMKIYEELEETILQLDNDLTSCKQTLNQKIHECDELQKENNELQGVIRTTTDCLEELHRSKSTSQNVPSHNADLRRQLEDSEAIRIEQEKKMKIYENQIKKLQDSIDRLQTENESLRTKVTTLEHRASSPVNLVPRYKPGCSDSTPHSFQKKTPPRSARRLIQSSTSSHGESESPKTSSVPPPTYSWETRRHSSYTSGDYVVSYAMKQQEESRKRDQLMASEDRDSAISPKKPAKPQSTVTHPYYPHSPAASTLWQEAIAFEKPYDPTIELSPSRDNRASELRTRRSRHSFEERTSTSKKGDSPDQTSQDLLYSPLEGTPRTESSSTQPHFTQPRILHQTKSYESPPSEKPHPQFSAKRNLDEEGERRPIGNSRWKLKGLISTRIAPIRLPASPTQQSFSNSYSGDSLALNSDRESSRYNSSHHQDNLVSSTRNKSQWQSARVQVSGNSCMTLSQLPSESKLHSLSTKTTTCSDSSDEYPKSKALEPSDESDHDFEIEGNDHDNDCDDDDSSVKVEVGDHYAVSRRTHRFVDLGNITLDCD